MQKTAKLTNLNVLVLQKDVSVIGEKNCTLSLQKDRKPQHISSTGLMIAWIIKQYFSGTVQTPIQQISIY